MNTVFLKIILEVLLIGDVFISYDLQNIYLWNPL